MVLILRSSLPVRKVLTMQGRTGQKRCPVIIFEGYRLGADDIERKSHQRIKTSSKKNRENVDHAILRVLNSSFEAITNSAFIRVLDDES